MNLTTIHLNNLPNLESSQFITLLFNDIKAIDVDMSYDVELVEAFEALKKQGTQFYNSIAQIRAMAESKELEALDMDRDEAIVTIRLHLAAFRHRKEPEIKKGLAAIAPILTSFQGLEDLNYEAESAGIRKFLDEWKKDENATRVNVLGLQLHLDNLETTSKAFDKVFNSRSATITSKEVLNARALKKEMFKTYTSIAKYILAMAEFKKDITVYTPLLKAFNSGRKYFADLMARKKGMDKGDGDAKP